MHICTSGRTARTDDVEQPHELHLALDAGQSVAFAKCLLEPHL